MPPIVVWDIDGTLVRSNGGRVAVNAFLRALRLASNLADELPYPKDSAGKTDMQIAIDVLVGAAIAESHAGELLSAFGEAYLAELQAQRAALATDLRVLPGVRDVLSRLSALGVRQSLLTGNLQPVARLKLACAQLDQYLEFDVGAFGSDHADRTCLVPIVRQRVHKRLGYEVAPHDVLVVGDTPRDIACARAGGARAIAVATGNFSRAELEAHQPDAVLDDLRDTEAVVATLLAYTTVRS